jgi:hypothetical protein
MNLRSVLIASALVLGLLIGASTAQAAKGVKKNPNQNGEHHHHGKVVEVNHKAGHMVIVAHHHTKKKVGNANGVVGAPMKFTVGMNTKFANKAGKQVQPTNFTALRVGEHVSVASHQHHADAVVIHRLAGKVKKGLKKKP